MAFPKNLSRLSTTRLLGLASALVTPGQWDEIEAEIRRRLAAGDPEAQATWAISPDPADGGETVIDMLWDIPETRATTDQLVDGWEAIDGGEDRHLDAMWEDRAEMSISY